MSSGTVALQCVASVAGTLIGESLGSTLAAKLAVGVLGALIGAFLTAPGRHRRRRIVAVAILIALVDALRRAAGALASGRGQEPRGQEPRAWVPANWAVVGLAAVVGFAAGSAVTTVRGAWADEPAAFTSVPTVRGEPREEALAILADAGLRARTATEPSEAIAPGSATRTIPGAGATVEEGADITLYVSAGPPDATVTVPDVTALQQDAAVAVLEDVGLRPEVDSEPSPTIEDGHATRTDPPAGTALDRGAAVTLFLSSGPAVERVAVPDVVGSTREQAYRALEEAGLRPEGSTEASDTVPAGTVVRSDPAAGTTVEEGSVVEVVVSSGPPPLVVPDVAGLPSDEAARRLKVAGLSSTTERVPSSDVPDGIVIATEPQGGSEVERGAEVNLLVSCGPGSCFELR